MVGTFQTSVGAHNRRSHRVEPYSLPSGVHTETDLLRGAITRPAAVSRHLD